MSVEGPCIVTSHEVESTPTAKMIGKSTASFEQSAKSTKEAIQLPFGVNRYVLLVLFGIVVLLKGCTYWGWNGMQDMLYKSGKFEWVCESVEKDQMTQMKVGDQHYPDCPERKMLINGLFSTALASHLITSVISGYFLDKFGPKITMLSSIVIDAAAWCLLFLSTRSFPLFYLGAFLLGLSVDPGYLPLLFISKLFPNAVSLILSILGSLRSVSFAIPVILGGIFAGNSIPSTSLWIFILSYLGIGLGICFIVSFLFVPYKKFEVETTEEAGAIEKPDSQDVSFFQILKTPKFLIIIPIFIIALIRTEFYTKSNKEQLVVYDWDANGKLFTTSDLYSLYSIFNILSFLPGPVMGKLVDQYGITFVLFILNTSGVIMFLFLMFNNYVCKVFSVLFYFIYTSFVLSNVYCYIAIHFPSRYFGKLCGFVSMMGGVFIFASVGFYMLSTDILLHLAPYNFLPMNGLMIAGGLLVYIFIFMLYRMGKKAPIEPKCSV